MQAQDPALMPRFVLHTLIVRVKFSVTLVTEAEQIPYDSECLHHERADHYGIFPIHLQDGQQ